MKFGCTAGGFHFCRGHDSRIRSLRALFGPVCGHPGPRLSPPNVRVTTYIGFVACAPDRLTRHDAIMAAEPSSSPTLFRGGRRNAFGRRMRIPRTGSHLGTTPRMSLSGASMRASVWYEHAGPSSIAAPRASASAARQLSSMTGRANGWSARPQTARASCASSTPCRLSNGTGHGATAGSAGRCRARAV